VDSLPVDRAPTEPSPKARTSFWLGGVLILGSAIAGAGVTAVRPFVPHGSGADEPFGLAARVARLFGGALPSSAGRLVLPLGIAMMLGAYLFALRLLSRRDDAASFRGILGVAAVAAIPFILSDVLLSPDVYMYAVQGRLWAVYGESPFAVYPALHGGDPFLGLIPREWAFSLPVYGPMWQLICAAVTWLGHRASDSIALTLLLFKLVALGSHLGSTAVIGVILRRLGSPRIALGMLAFGWNPLLLAESAWNAHNDAALLLLLLVAFLLAIRGRPAAGMVPLIASLLLKWVTAAVLPLYLLCWLRGARSPGAAKRMILSAVATSVLTVLGILLPLFVVAGRVSAEPIVVPLHAQAFHHFTNSSLAHVVVTELASRRGMPYVPPGVALRNAYRPVMEAYAATGRIELSRALYSPPDRTESIVRLLALAISLLFGLRALWRVRDPESLLEQTALVLFVYVAISAVWFQAYYLTWVLGPACLLAGRRLFWAAIMLSVTAWARYLGDGHMLGALGVRFHPLLTFLPPLLWLGLGALRARVQEIRVRGLR
jgi:hypothetical protein